MSWRDHAACRGQDPAHWYPERGRQATHGRTICAACPVRTTCATEGATEGYGLWGGRSPVERGRSGNLNRSHPLDVGVCSGCDLRIWVDARAVARTDLWCDNCRPVRLERTA